MRCSSSSALRMQNFILAALACILACATAFVPGANLRRSVHAAGITSSAARVRSGGQQLSMGFDFGKMIEKMGDTRYARCRHILIEEKGQEAQARLQGLKDEIAGDIDKFSEVAETVSTCTSAKNGGRLKLLARGETVPEFDDVLFTQDPGAIYGPVETAYGTHLIYLESCNKPENTWKMMFDSIVGKASGKDDEEKQQ